jgi:hypothetical protein
MGWFTKCLLQRGARRNVARCWHVGLAIAAKSVASLAEGDLTPYATGSYEYQSNPFYQWSGSPAQVAESADYLVMLRAGMDARLGLSRQSLAATAELRRFDYRDLTFLERTEEMLNGSYHWALTSLVNGSLEYRHEHRMVPFDELADTRELLMETEDAGAASLNLTSRKGWRLENRVKVRDLASPRPGVPDLSLHETSIHEAVRRALKTVSVGLDGEYVSGSYGGAGQLPRPHYRETTLQLAGERRIAGFSTFECAVGYTRRNDAVGGGASAVTGLLGYQREITSKTSAEARLRRVINSYVSSAGSEIDTSLALGVAWRPTAKIQVAPGLTLMRSEFPRQTFASESSRHDRYRVLVLDIRYQALDWLSLNPYARRALRTSSVPSFGFNASAVGLELVFKESR